MKRFGQKSMSTSSPEKLFISKMIPHHETAINMAKSALKNKVSGLVKEMARGIIAKQTEEVKTMRKWMKKWK